MSIFTFSKPYSNDFWSGFYDTNLTPSTVPAKAHTFDYVLRGFPVSFLAGSLAGVSTSLLSCPFELTKLGSQIELVMKRRDMELNRILIASQSKAPSASRLPPLEAPKPLGAYQIAQKLVRHSGIFSLYSGYSYQVVRDVIGTGIYFGVYDSIKSAVSVFFFATTDSHPVSVAIAGGLSGGFSWIFVYPLDTLKSRYQRDVMSRVLSADSGQPAHAPGGAGTPAKVKVKDLFKPTMYRGLGISLVRTSILGTTMFSIYEMLMQMTD